MTPSASNNSVPRRFCPPSPRVADRYAVRTPWPRDNHASNALFSSSGWAPVWRTLPITSRRFNAWASPAAPRSSATSAAGTTIAGAIVRAMVKSAIVTGGNSLVLIRLIAKSHEQISRIVLVSARTSHGKHDVNTPFILGRTRRTGECLSIGSE